MATATDTTEWVEAEHPETGNFARFTRSALDEVYRIRGWRAVGEDTQPAAATVAEATTAAPSSLDAPKSRPGKAE